MYCVDQEPYMWAKYAFRLKIISIIIDNGYVTNVGCVYHGVLPRN